MNGNKAWDYMVRSLVGCPENNDKDNVGVAYAEKFLLDDVRIVRTTQYYKKEQANDRPGSA